MIASLAGVTHRHLGSGFVSGMDGLDLLPPDVAEKVTEDEGQRQQWSALYRQACAIRSLQRIPAPSDLDGRVVASLQTGHRQDRAVACVQAQPVQKAPAILDELVRRDLERPFQDRPQGNKSLVAGSSSTRPRIGESSAPSALDGLVAERIAKDMARSGSHRRVRLHIVRMTLAASLLAAMGLGVLAVLGGERGEPRTLETASFSFNIVRVGPDQADAELASLLGALSGGALDGRERGR